MKKRSAASWLCAVVLALGACAPAPTAMPDSSVVAPPRCVQGTSAMCGCTDGRTGAQLCASDGVFSACVCTGASPTDPPPARCVPNQSVACYCEDLRMGVQTCGADGTFPACRCAAPAMDAAVPEDVAAPIDAVESDATSDAAAGDATADGRVVPVGCNPDGGIECDGDWAGRCAGGCSATQCCSPRSGSFRCVAKDAAGRCPAADLSIDAERARTSATVRFQWFDPSNCALMERCVRAPGLRRLLRFDTRTPNQGQADMYLGAPATTNPYFEYSSCHRHYHFNTYANYQLLASDGTVAATGHKQAFCLEDTDRSDPTAPAAGYNCGNQGISVGWSDVYNSGLDCQWIDVTDVAPGTYMLNVSINEEHVLNESDYSNNVARVPVTIVAPTADEMSLDPTRPCTAPQQGLARNCGWSVEGAHTCTPGTMVTATCSATCGAGSCTGDTMLRVYDGDRSGAGAITPGITPIVQNDDSGCPRSPGMTGNDLCSRGTFTCPSSGRYTVLTGAYRSNEVATCNVVVAP